MRERRHSPTYPAQSRCKEKTDCEETDVRRRTCIPFCGCEGDYYDSNRCVTRDTNHTFTETVILVGSSNVTVKATAWKDFEQSGSVQLWIDTGKAVPEVIYTHPNNVILRNLSPRYLPKFNKVF